MTTLVVRRAGRSEVRLVLALLALTAAAWALTAGRMAGMDAGPASELGGIGWFAVTWLLMMAAMMLPALTPMVVAHSRRAGSRVETAAFAAGYLAAWVAAGFVAYAAIQSVRSSQLGFFSWNDGGRFVAAAVIAGAGVYQLSMPKRAFLRSCCERARFVDEHYRRGAPGALRMGIEHGRDCVGSSWALTAALFALGVMSLTWMALVAMLIAAERLLPRATRIAVALVFLALGTGVALAPGRMPGFTVPGTKSMSPHRMAAVSAPGSALAEHGERLGDPSVPRVVLLRLGDRSAL